MCVQHYVINYSISEDSELYHTHFYFTDSANNSKELNTTVWLQNQYTGPDKHYLHAAMIWT